MGSLNTLSGALSLSVIAMGIVFAVLGGLALMMVLIKYIALLLERPLLRVEEPEVKVSLREAKEELKVSSEVEVEEEIAAIAGAIAALTLSAGKPLRVWRVSGPIKSLWREAAKVESMIGGNGNE